MFFHLYLKIRYGKDVGKTQNSPLSLSLARCVNKISKMLIIIENREKEREKKRKLTRHVFEANFHEWKQQALKSYGYSVKANVYEEVHHDPL